MDFQAEQRNEISPVLFRGETSQLYDLDISGEFWKKIKPIRLMIPNALKDQKGFQLIHYTPEFWAVNTERWDITTCNCKGMAFWEKGQARRYIIKVLDDDNHITPVASRITSSFEEAIVWHFSTLAYLNKRADRCSSE